MASHFRWYPSEAEVVVPFNARYSFPSQANKTVKITPRIPPKNASVFNPGQVIRLEFPAQGYVNPGKTTLEFDCQIIYDYSKLTNAGSRDDSFIRFQNNIQSTFSRVRLLYGATPLEDIIDYNVIVRLLTEWTSTNQTSSADQTSITEGIGGVTPGSSGSTNVTDVGARNISGLVNTRQTMIQGYQGQDARLAAWTAMDGYSAGVGAVPNAAMTRRYQVQLALGLLTQEKLLPTKFMASQLAIEITLAEPAACMIYNVGEDIITAHPNLTKPTYQLSNVNIIPEILEFDASYDESFIKGLMSGGVPLKFATWNTYKFSTGGGSSVNLQIQERSRSVKSLFAVQRREPPSLDNDAGATFFTSHQAASSTFGALQEYQYRIGGRYFPAQPVQLVTEVGGQLPNGGAEAFVELSKALNTLGDYRLSTSVNANKWAVLPARLWSDVTSSILPEQDYKLDYVGFTPEGAPKYQINEDAKEEYGRALAGSAGSCCFAMAIDLETSSGVEISGLNAEEQSDISLIARFANPQKPEFIYEVFSYIDSMVILRENNVNIITNSRYSNLSNDLIKVNLCAINYNGKLWS